MNPAGELLLQRRVGTSRCSVPGGICELGESFEDTLRHEVREESELIAEHTELLAVVSSAETFRQLANGHEFFTYTAVFKVSAWSGTPTPDGVEGEELRFFSPQALPPLAGPVGRHLARVFG